jgi:predicted dehydrogenase
MSPEPLALGLVGCGRLASDGYVPALAPTAGPAFRLVAVADPDPGRRERVSRLAGGDVAGFPDAAALLAGSRLDALVLATPAALHLGDAERASASGVPVLVEKPPAPDVAGAAALAALSPAPWVGFNRRFDPGAAAVRRAVPAVGPVDLRIEISYRRRSWGAHAVRDDALLDLGPHLVDWARWIGGRDVVEVRCPELSAERAALELVLAGDRAGAPGGVATLRAATDRPHAELVELRDASGDVRADHRLGGLAAAVRGRVAGVLGRVGGSGAGSGAGRPSALVASLAGQLDALAAAVRGAPPADLGTAADGVAAMAVLDAARASAAGGGRTVPVHRPVET